MTISKEKADRLVEIAKEMEERLDEFKRICRNTMKSSEYNRFKYNTLAHIEPGLIQEHDWVATGTQSLAEVAEEALNECQFEEEEDTVDQ